MKWRQKNPYAPSLGLWFAWRPVKCHDGFVRWMEWVWRSRVYVTYYMGGGWETEYYSDDNCYVAKQLHDALRVQLGARR